MKPPERLARAARRGESHAARIPLPPKDRPRAVRQAVEAKAASGKPIVLTNHAADCGAGPGAPPPTAGPPRRASARRSMERVLATLGRCLTSQEDAS